MRSGFRQWFAERAEILVLGVTVLVTASLVFWWTILLGGEMRNNEALERALLDSQAGLATQEVAERRAEIAARHERRKVMLVGESTLLALLLSAAVRQPGVVVRAGAATQAAARRHGKAVAVHQP
jgi:hypothetical protein